MQQVLSKGWWINETLWLCNAFGIQCTLLSPTTPAQVALHSWAPDSYEHFCSSPSLCAHPSASQPSKGLFSPGSRPFLPLPGIVVETQ